MTETWEQAADRLAAASLAEGSPTAWFDRLYRGAADGQGGWVLPWDRETPSPPLAAWAPGRVDAGTRAVVVGCGLGADAEYLAGLGAQVTAFDISPTAVELAAARHPGSSVAYRQADLFDLPAGWAFDLVVEIFTVQAMPEDVRAAATAAVAGLVGPGGTLLVVTLLRDGPMALAEGPPWPLTPAQLDAFAAAGLEPGPARCEAGPRDLWRAEFRRPKAGQHPRTGQHPKTG